MHHLLLLTVSVLLLLSCGTAQVELLEVDITPTPGGCLVHISEKYVLKLTDEEKITLHNLTIPIYKEELDQTRPSEVTNLNSGSNDVTINSQTISKIPYDEDPEAFVIHLGWSPSEKIPEGNLLTLQVSYDLDGNYFTGKYDEIRWASKRPITEIIVRQHLPAEFVHTAEEIAANPLSALITKNTTLVEYHAHNVKSDMLFHITTAFPTKNIQCKEDPSLIIAIFVIVVLTLVLLVFGVVIVILAICFYKTLRNVGVEATEEESKPIYEQTEDGNTVLIPKGVTNVYHTSRAATESNFNFGR